MGGKKKNKSKKSKTKAQQMATKRISEGKTISQVKAANKQSMRDAAAARNKAFQAAKKDKNDSKKTTGIGPVASGSAYAKSLSTATNQPTKKTTAIGPYADGAKYAAALKANPPQPSSSPKFKEGQQVAMDNLGGPAAVIGGLGTMTIMGANAIKNTIQNLAPKFKEKMEQRVNPDADKISAAGDIGNLTGLGIGTGAPSYFSVKSPESFGAPSQAETDAAAGITAGGLNIGGGGFTPSNPSGGSTSRAISDRPASSFSFGPTADGNEYARNLSEFGMRFGATPEARGKAYEQSLDPNSFKGLSDGMTFGVGPVASGDAYARGLNTDNKNVENRLRQVRNLGSTLTGGLIPSVRKLTDKEIADRRIKNAAFREANLVGRNRGGGGARLPVAPLTPEEILLPEEAAVAQTGPDYQQAQTGLDPNRLMQIQQDAYLQAFNPSYNPMFRFFGRRRPGGGAFRRAFRRD